MNELVAELMAELANVRLGWEWTTAHAFADELNQAADTLCWLYESQSNCREGVPLFGQAVRRLLTGSLAGVDIVGVPDVLARDADGTLCVADYKTGKPISSNELAESAQMAIYVELLQQNGYITEDDRVRIGHIHLTETGVLPVWTDTALHATVLQRLGRQLAVAAALMDNQLFSARKGLDAFQSPCAFCDVAHVCDA